MGIVIVSLARFWNDTLSCLPDFSAVNSEPDRTRALEEPLVRVLPV